eukprot:COSAG01_NODE_1365_length_10560_cov_38.008986_2_plen_149_part_00
MAEISPVAGFRFGDDGGGLTDVSEHSTRRVETLPFIDWRQRLLIGCAQQGATINDGDDDDGGGGGGGGGGDDDGNDSSERIVVFGDAAIAASQRRAAPPRVFTDVLPHECRNPLRATAVAYQWERVKSAHTDCRWGTVLDNTARAGHH